MVKYIYYTGIGAKKSGKHTIKEFLDIMNKTANIECSDYMAKLEYKPCGTSAKMQSTIVLSKSKKNHKRYKKLVNKCQTYKKTKTRKCNLDEYITFSGAEKK
jgi:hypothetical protein